MKRHICGFRWAVPTAFWMVLVAVIPGSMADTPPELTITSHLSGIDTQKTQDWEAAWLTDNSAVDLPAVKAVVQLSKLDRQTVKQELAIASQQDRYKAIKRNLDIGRHELLKRVIAAAIVEANKRLDKQKLTRLKQLTLINCGGVGDFARDQDITAFADDPLRERVFFESLLEVADSMGIKGEPQNKTLGLKSGINFHGLEVTFHAGKNDLPDTASTTERMSFALDYRKVIESQAKAPEAYFGYGAELEVQANRIAIPGTASKTKMQVFRCEDGVTVRYTGVLQASAEEVNGVTRYTRGSRVRAAQHAVHMTNNFLQATRHSLDPASAPSQGPLKYAGRTLDHLCQLRGMEPWSKLELPDRIELLRPLFPADLPDAQVEKLATSMAHHLDVAEMTLRNKAVPESIGKVPVDPAVSAKVASIFMRKAAAETAKHLAAEMLQPPPFDHDLMPRLAAAEGKNWHHLSLAEKGILARKYDKSYQENVSIAAMENLLITMRCLKDLDALDDRGVGSQAIAEVVNAARPTDPKDPRQKQLYELMQLAADHAEVTVEREQSTDPNVRRALGQHMDRLRYEVATKAAAYERTQSGKTGQDLIAAAAKSGAQSILDNQRKGVPNADLENFRKMRGKYVGLRYAWSEVGDGPTPEQVKEMLKARGGLKARLSEKLWDETMQLGNVVLALQLLEMYQNESSGGDYALLLTSDLIGRYRWYLGYFAQGAQIRSQQQAIDLGKNLVFDLLSRVVPGVGTIKVVFDIERGLVMVTVGYTINQLNASLVDALYTGPAGRLNDGTSGKVAGSIRDTNICVLPAPLVIRKVEKEKARIEIDRPALYRHFFKEFAGIEHDYLPRPAIADKARSSFISAHDAFINAMQKLSDQTEPTWFGTVAQYIRPAEVDESVAAFKKVLEERCAQAADAVIAQLAVREFYVKDADGKSHEVISETLRGRLMTDFLSGMMSTWQSGLLEKVLLKRQIESLADTADVNVLADMLSKEACQHRTSKGNWVLSIDHGLPSVDSELDGNMPLPLVCELRRMGAPGEDLGQVVLEVKPGNYEPVDRNYRPAGLIMAGSTVPAKLTDTALFWKDVVRQQVAVRALANGGGGPVLAEASSSFYVRLRPPERRIIRLEDLKLAPGEWPSFFTSEGRFCSITRLTDVQPLENWKLEPGRSVGETGHSKLVYNVKRDADDFVWKDEQEIDMSWAVERADGGPAHIETPDTNIIAVQTDDGSVIKKVQLTGEVAGLIRYRYTSMAGDRRTGFTGRLIFMYGNHRGVICMRSKTSSKNGESRVDESAMPQMMQNVATLLVQKLKGGYGAASQTAEPQKNAKPAAK